jgi:hypothetical protein
MKKTKLNYPTNGAMKEKAYQLCADSDSVYYKILHAFAWFQDQVEQYLIEQYDFKDQIEGFLSQLLLAKKMNPDDSFAELVEEALEVHIQSRLHYGHKED